MASRRTCASSTSIRIPTSIYRNSVLAGKVRNGAVYMPPYAGILSQEAIWAIKAYLETRRASLDN